MLHKPCHIHLFDAKALLFALLCLCANVLLAQMDSIPNAPIVSDSSLQADSTIRPLFFGEITPADSSRPQARRLGVASGGLDEKVDYGARDSMYFDVKNKQVHLYGEAFVRYTTVDVKAGYIILDYGNDEVRAESVADSLGKMSGVPEFKEGEQTFTAQKLRYNFKTKKGVITEARTQQSGLYVLGEKAKFTGTETQTDSGTTTQNIVYNKDAIITTCQHEEPHYGIRTKKLKVIPNKMVIAGLSNVEIEGIPTPLFLPFGFYPITKTKKSGILLPNDFQFFSQSQGLGIRGLGWYQPINEYMDLTTRVEYYVRGTWGVGTDLQYTRRYKYNGNLHLEFNDRKQENRFAQRYSTKSFAINWRHNQDSKAHPTRTVGGSINLQTSRNDNTVYNDFQSVFRNQLSSNMTFTQNFPGKPYSFNTSFTHSQNNQTREMTVSFPNATFQMQRIYPLKRKNPVGRERWYEKVTLSYKGEARNQMNGIDSTFFTQETLNKAKFGVQHTVSSDIQLKLFKYINVAPRVTYDESWYFRRTEFEFNPTIIEAYDTALVDGQQILSLDSTATRWGKVDTNLIWGFLPYRNYNAGISTNTNLYFTKRFKKGWLRGIRHVMTPQASIGFGPDYSENTDYFRRYQYSKRPGFDTLTRPYSIFDGAIFGRPSSSARSTAISFSLRNVLEMKYFSRKDTTGNPLKKKTIFNNLTFSGSYSLTADSLKWSTIGTGGSFRLFKGITNINWNMTLDPYVADSLTGRRIDRFALKEEGKLFRMTNLGSSFTTRMTIKQLRDIVSGKEEVENRNPERENNRPITTAQGQNQPNLADATLTFASVFDKMSINHYFQLNRELQRNGRDTFLLRSHTMGISGSLPLTSKWELGVGNISYDFKTKRLIYPDIRLSRNLHCWRMDFNWQPVRGTFNLQIYVQDGTLNFLKLPYRRNNLDPPLGF